MKVPNKTIKPWFGHPPAMPVESIETRCFTPASLTQKPVSDGFFTTKKPGNFRDLNTEAVKLVEIACSRQFSSVYVYVPIIGNSAEDYHHAVTTVGYGLTAGLYSHTHTTGMIKFLKS